MNMVAVRLPKQVVEEARRCADAQFRSLPKQIEYWYRLGKAAEENPDLPIEFIKKCLMAKEEPEEPFNFEQ